VVEGITVSVLWKTAFTSFEVTANADGPLDPPEPAAAVWAGFPTPREYDTTGYPTDRQQVGPAIWLIHTGDNGGSSGGGTRSSYAAFLTRVTRPSEDGGARLSRLGSYDWEMRFTGSNSDPGVGGSYAWGGAFSTVQAYWVPFELLCTGIDTPDDPSDDLRLIPWILGGATGDGFPDNWTFDLSQYGSAAAHTCHDGCEHSVSGGDDDPYTDLVYWRLPEDQTPGDAGYKAFEAAMISDPMNWPGNELPVIDRTVLVNWDGGVTPPFDQALPEQGTIFRLKTAKFVSGDSFTFRADPPDTITSGTLGLAIFLKYKLINKGNQTLRSFLLSFWLDPDLGGSGDDLVGCDTLDNRFFCYNADNDDSQYGVQPPAVGFRVVEGPITPSPGDTAVVDGLPRPNYKNLGIYSFNKYINGTDPDNNAEAYQYMLGLDPKNGGIPYINPTNGLVTRFAVSGDPVSGAGWCDDTPSDRRMMASFGPFTFRPGDTQQVLFKMAVGQGLDRLSSITSLREILGYSKLPSSCCSNRVGDANGNGGDEPDVGDVSVMIDAKFITGTCDGITVCLAEADINQSGGATPTCDDITIGDISTLIDYLFITGPSIVLPDCL